MDTFYAVCLFCELSLQLIFLKWISWKYSAKSLGAFLVKKLTTWKLLTGFLTRSQIRLRSKLENILTHWIKSVPIFPHSHWIQENMDQKNSKYRHFSCSDIFLKKFESTWIHRESNIQVQDNSSKSKIHCN